MRSASHLLALALTLFAAASAAGCGDPAQLLKKLEPKGLRYARDMTKTPPPAPNAMPRVAIDPARVQRMVADQQRRMRDLQQRVQTGDPIDMPALRAENERAAQEMMDELRAMLPPAQRAQFDAAIENARAQADAERARAERKMRALGGR